MRAACSLETYVLLSCCLVISNVQLFENLPLGPQPHTNEECMMHAHAAMQHSTAPGYQDRLHRNSQCMQRQADTVHDGDKAWQGNATLLQTQHSTPTHLLQKNTQCCNSVLRRHCNCCSKNTQQCVAALAASVGPLSMDSSASMRSEPGKACHNIPHMYSCLTVHGMQNHTAGDCWQPLTTSKSLHVAYHCAAHM